MTTHPKEQNVDVAIVGGGMVGSTLAIALDALALKVAVIDPHLQNSELAPGFDARAIALSWGSMRIFNTLNLWDLDVTENFPTTGLINFGRLIIGVGD